MVDQYKAYNDFFGALFDELERIDLEMQIAEILNWIDIALDERNEEWFKELVKQLRLLEGNHGTDEL